MSPILFTLVNAIFLFQGIFITKILPDGPAKGILEPGDKLLKVSILQNDYPFISYAWIAKTVLPFQTF